MLLSDLWKKYKPIIQQDANKVSNFVKQNPSPASFVNKSIVQPKIQSVRNDIDTFDRGLGKINSFVQSRNDINQQQINRISPTLGKVNSFVQAAQPQKIASNFVVKPFLRTGAEAVNTLRGNKEFTPTSNIAKMALGDQKVTNVPARFKYNTQELQKMGAGKASIPLSLVGTALAVGGDLTPVGGAGDKLAGKLAKAAKTEEVIKLLGKGNKLAQDTRLVDSLVKETDPKGISKILESAKQGTSSIDNATTMLKRGFGEDFEVSKFFHDTFKAPDNVLYIKPKVKPNQKLSGYLEKLGQNHIIDKVEEAGGNGVLKVTIKKDMFDNTFGKPVTDALSNEARKINILPSDISLADEMKAVGAKRIAPDRVTHHRFTPQESISALKDRIANSIATLEQNRPVRASKSVLDQFEKVSKKVADGSAASWEKSWFERVKDQMPSAKAYDDLVDFVGDKNLGSKTTIERAKSMLNDVAISEHYKKLVKKDISKGFKFPDEVLNYDKSFKTAVDSRARYEKGLATSFSADDTRIVFDPENRIVAGMKRQDGKPILPKQQKEIIDGIAQTQNALGIDLNKMSKDERWVYAHLNGKNPFLMKNTAGLYRKGNGQVSISLGGTESFDVVVNGEKVRKKVNTTMSHELGHALDYNAGKRLLDRSTYYDLAMQYNPIEASSRSSKYWNSEQEITARAIEQYVAVKEGHTGIYSQQGMWNKEIFDSKIKPAVEKAISEKFPEYKIYSQPLSPQSTQGATPKINLLKSGNTPLMIEGSRGTKRTIPLADYQGVMLNPKKIKVTGRGATGKIEVAKPTAFIPPKDIGVGTKIKRAFTSGDVELGRQGKAGQELADKIKFQRTNAEQLRGGYQVKLQEALQGLNQSERNVVGQVLDGQMQVNNPRIIQAVQKTRAILDDIGSKAEQIGLQIKTPSGEVPFRMKDNYYPRVYDFTDLQKASQRQRAMQHLVDSGQAQNIAEADKMLETFIKDNTIRRAGNLEHARVLDLPGYELDPLKAINKYIDSASRRLTEANTFGATDEIAKRLIDRVRTEGGDYKYAQEVFDLMTGQKKYQNLAVDLATKFNYITKLDLGFITNATQPINTAVKTGIINTLDGVMKAYLTPYKAGKFARQIGAVTDEVVKGKAEGLTMGRIMETILAPFSFVERKNRVISAVAGKNFAEQLANKILKNPENKYALRQLKSIGLDPEKIIAQGKITPDDILGGAKAVSDTTQFKVDAIDIPPGWKTNIGRLLTQFKSFSFQQTKFIRDEVIKEATAGNFAPLMKLIVLAVPASFVAQSVRNKLTGRTPKEEEKSLDVRKLDQYLRAFGTIPTDLISQGKFLADTYNNDYATPLKKVGRTVSTIAGPTAGEAFNLVNAFEQAGTISKNNQQYNQEKDPYLEAKRLASGYIPFVGEAIKNKVFAYPATYAKGAETAGKTITQQIKDLQKGKKTSESPIAQMADGKFRYRVGAESKYADTQEEAQIGINKDAFKKSGKAFEIKDGLVYRKSKDGDVSTETELSYNTKLITQKMESAKTSKNFTEWMKLAEQQEQNIAEQFKDPTLDELERTELQQKYDKLITDAQKYAGYGGFTKGKSGKKVKLKYETVKLANTSKKIARRNPKKIALPKAKRKVYNAFTA